jgi:hypothetical protein
VAHQTGDFNSSADTVPGRRGEGTFTDRSESAAVADELEDASPSARGFEDRPSRRSARAVCTGTVLAIAISASPPARRVIR